MHHDQLSTNCEKILGEKSVCYYLMLMLEIMPEGEAWTHVSEWREKDGDRSVERESGLKRCNDAKPSSLSRPGLAWRTNCSLARLLACVHVCK